MNSDTTNSANMANDLTQRFALNLPKPCMKMAAQQLC